MISVCHEIPITGSTILDTNNQIAALQIASAFKTPLNMKTEKRKIVISGELKNQKEVDKFNQLVREKLPNNV